MGEVKYEEKKLKIYYEEKKIKKGYYEGKQVYSSGSTVTYYVDSGISYTEEVDEGESCLSPKTFAPAKSGWTFVGWRADTTASGTVYTSKVMGDEPVALYAVFKTGVTVGYYNGTTSIATQTKERYYNNGNIANPSFTLTQKALSGWAARGWSTGTTAAASILYNNGATFTRDSNITLYGMYYQTVTVSYNGNGNTSGSVAADSGIRYYNSNGAVANPSFMLKSNSFAKTGYTFVKWGLNSATGTQYAPGTSVSLAGSITMYAIWRPANITTALTAAVNRPELVVGYRNSWYGGVYDLTNVTTITFTFDYYYKDEDSDIGSTSQKYYYNMYKAIVGVSSDKSTYKASNTFAFGNYSYTKTMSGSNSLTVNVSSLTGNHYIGIGIEGYNSYEGEGSALKGYSNQDYYAKITGVTFA